MNTFQKSFDSFLRAARFSLNQGHWGKYLLNRFRWYMYPRLGKVSPFPLHVDIEVTARCNLRCPMCPSRHLTDEVYGQYGHMDFSLFKTLIDECAQNQLFSIRLSWRGEVLVHPQILRFIDYAKRIKKIPNVSFLTNGALLRGKLAERLVDYGVDYISVSIDGLAEMYEQIRHPMQFDRIWQNLRNLKELREKKHSRKPQIRVTTLWPAIAKDPTAYYRKMAPVCDAIVFNPLKDYNLSEPKKENFICQFPWERLFVGFNGDIHPCSNTKDPFVIGNAHQTSLAEAWQGKRLHRIREIHASGSRLKLFPCNSCSYGIDYSSFWASQNWETWNPQSLLPTKPLEQK